MHDGGGGHIGGGHIGGHVPDGTHHGGHDSNHHHSGSHGIDPIPLTGQAVGRQQGQVRVALLAIVAIIAIAVVLFLVI
jgi:hypothetical protein